MSYAKLWLVVKVFVFLTIFIYLWSQDKEGFIEFNKTLSPNSVVSTEPNKNGDRYTIQKLFDNLYYHASSGTLLEIHGPAMMENQNCSASPVNVLAGVNQKQSITQITTKSHNTGEVLDIVGASNVRAFIEDDLPSLNPPRTDIIEYQRYVTKETTTSTYVVYILIHNAHKIIHIVKESDSLICATFSFHATTNSFYIPSGIVSIPSCVKNINPDPEPREEVPEDGSSDRNAARNEERQATRKEERKEERQAARKEERQAARKEERQAARKADQMTRPVKKEPVTTNEPFALFSKSTINIPGYDNPITRLGQLQNMGFDEKRMNFVSRDEDGMFQFRDRFGTFLSSGTQINREPLPGISSQVHSWEYNVSDQYMAHTIVVPKFIYIIVLDVNNSTNHYVYEFKTARPSDDTSNPTDPLPDPTTTTTGTTDTPEPETGTGTSNAAGNAVTNTANAAGNAVTNTANAAGNAVTGTSEAIGNAVTNTANAAGTAITGTANAAGTAITGTANAAGTAITGTANATANAITGTAEVVGNTVNTATLATGAVAVQAINKAEESLRVIATTSGSVVEKTVDTAGNTIVSTVDVAGNTISKTVDTAGNTITQTVDTAGNTISSTVDTAGAVLSGASDNLAGVANNAINSFESIVNTSVGSFFHSINQAISGLFNILGNGKHSHRSTPSLISDPVSASTASEPATSTPALKHPYIVYPNSGFQVQPMPASYASFSSY